MITKQTHFQTNRNRECVIKKLSLKNIVKDRS